jgi:hypothetical protein
VDHRFRQALFERARGPERCLDRSDPAAEGVEPVEEGKLALGGRDDEDEADPSL